MTDKDKDKEKDKGGGGQPTVELQIQTPRGLWNAKEPREAKIRPTYPISTKVEQVIADARKVFGFVEDDNKYQLLLGEEKLDPQLPLARYHLKDGVLLVLTVQGGNAYQNVDSEVTLQSLTEELVEAAQFAASANLALDTSGLTQDLVFRVRFFNRAGEFFFVRFDCSDYPLFPPLIEFTDESGADAGSKHQYPNVFHAAPCVCMRYNRKAYVDLGGPHGDWRMVDWHLATPGGGPIGSLAMIFSDLHAKILDSTGRME
jgi:hypothetical protein